MKISQLKEYQTVNRPFRDSSGTRVYNEIEFEKKFNPTIKSLNTRLFAKLIDLVIIFLLANYLSKAQFVELKYLLCVAPLGFILFNSILESVIGASIGKLIFRVEIVNDNCNYLSFKNSLFRNLYAFTILCAIIFLYAGGTGTDNYMEWLGKKKYYIIKSSQKKNIKKMMKQQVNS